MNKFFTLCAAALLTISLSANAGDKPGQQGKKSKPAKTSKTTKTAKTTKTVAKETGPKFDEGDVNSSVRWDKLTWDFGDVTYGADCSHAFMFKNVSQKPVTITAVNTSCGCTKAGSTEEPVMPNKTGNVTARYNNNTIPGAFTKTITVTLDNGEAIMLTIKGNIKEQGK
ncbi:MAG: DUF1573 domain-containing protein [Bacteroidota bacterium]|nr:DUF1573 domain-containing protein [Bacteroidota bacterium]